jgi:IS605 OrfB family transposase
MHLTFHTAVPADAPLAQFLGGMARTHSVTERKLYAAIAAGKYDNAAFKRGFCSAHGLTSRQFNSMSAEVRGKIDGVREALKDHAETLRGKVKALRRAVADLDKMLETGLSASGRRLGKDRLAKKAKSRHEKKRKIGRLLDGIADLERRVEADAPGLCFGGRDLFAEQFERGVKRKKWRKKWRAKRDSQFLLVGSADEATGCVSCQATPEDDGTVTLRVRPFNAMLEARDKPTGLDEADMKRRKTVTAKESDYVVIRGLKFTHGAKHIRDAILKNQSKDPSERTPLTWRFLCGEDGEWRVFLSLDVSETAVFSVADGAVGVDFNEDHIAATVVDCHGNFVCCRRFDLNLHGVKTLQARDMIRCVARDVVAWAKSLGLPIVGEELDFKKKKKAMGVLSAKRKRKLSSLHYSAWGQALRSRCLKDGVALRLVDPAYSSLIGRVKFAVSLGLSVHHAAALVIARRGMRLSERLPRSVVRLPDNNGGHVTLGPLAKMGNRHVWSSWAGAAKTVNAALAARSSAKRRQRKLASSSSATVCPVREEDCAIPDFRPALEGMRTWETPGEAPGRRPDLPVDGRQTAHGGYSALSSGITTPERLPAVYW